MKKDILVIGAGASGVGIGCILEKYFPCNYLIVEKGKQVGNSFANWTQETQFISPSFLSKEFGIKDLNAVSFEAEDSPGLFLGKERFTGKEYQSYLKNLSENQNLKISFDTEIVKVEKKEEGFILQTKNGDRLEAKVVLYAGGEFSFPCIPGIPGREFGVHNAQMQSYSDIQDEEIVVVGGYESGVDTAYNLIKNGKKVTMLERENLSLTSSDPSVSLSLHSQSRLTEIENNENFKIIEHFEVAKIEEKSETYTLFSKNGETVITTGKIIFATGFDFSDSLFGKFFDFENGKPKLTNKLESTKVENLFLVGPMVQIQGLIFCFIYKYKILFPIVILNMIEKVGIDSRAFRSDFHLPDIEELCGDACGCC